MVERILVPDCDNQIRIADGKCAREMHSIGAAQGVTQRQFTCLPLHSTFGREHRLIVYDVWDSQADFDAFGQTLMPILGELGIDAGQPDVMPVHNIVQ